MQKYENLVDLEKCCKMSIWLQRLASIQKRTSLSKFAKISPEVRKKVRINIGFQTQRIPQSVPLGWPAGRPRRVPSAAVPHPGARRGPDGHAAAEGGRGAATRLAAGTTASPGPDGFRGGD